VLTHSVCTTQKHRQKSTYNGYSSRNLSLVYKLTTDWLHQLIFLTDRNLDRKNYVHRLPVAAPPSPNTIDAEDELDQCDAELSGTNATFSLERSGCSGSSTWSGERALFGLHHQLRNDSYDAATLLQKSCDLEVHLSTPGLSAGVTSVVDGKDTISISETMQNDITSLPRHAIRRSR